MDNNNNRDYQDKNRNPREFYREDKDFLFEGEESRTPTPEKRNEEPYYRPFSPDSTDDSEEDSDSATYPNSIPMDQTTTKPKNDVFDDILYDIRTWTKKLFSSDYTDAMVEARDKEKSKYTWAAILLVYVLLNPILASLYQFFRGNLFSWVGMILVFLSSLLQSVIGFALIVLILFLTQKVFDSSVKERKFSVLNASSLLLIPRIMALVIMFLLNLIPLIRELAVCVLAIYLALSTLLYLRFVPAHKKRKHSGIYVLLLLAFLILVLGTNLVGVHF